MNYFNCPAETLPNRIVAAWMEWMTPHPAPDPHEGPFDDPVTRDGLPGVLRARRLESTGARKKRREEPLIEADGADGDNPHDRILANILFTSASTPA